MASLKDSAGDMLAMWKHIAQRAKEAERLNPPPPRQYKCPICQDVQWLFVIDETGEERARECECLKHDKIDRLMHSSQIAEGFLNKTFANFSVAGRPLIVVDAMKCASSYCKSFLDIEHMQENSLALLGTTGSGKTHLLMAAANVLMNAGVQVLYFPWVEGFNDIKDDFDMLATKMHKLQEARVLFIDDAFKGRAQLTDFQREQLFALINYRYLNRKPVMISSEIPLRDIYRMDNAIGGRLAEMTREFRVELTGCVGLDYRMRGIS
jgi:DNA replication protein DnaC